MNYLNYHTGRPRFHFEENAGGAAADTAAAAAVSAAASAAAAASAGAAKAWHDGIDAEYIGHAQNKGWKLDDPKEAFAAAAKVARDLEKHFGAPPDRIVKMPAADARPEDIRAFHERLGAPKEAKDYDLTAVKDSTIAEQLRATAFDAGLSKDAATKVAASVAKALESKETTSTTLTAAKLAEQRANLVKNWGDKYDYNQLQAMDGARKLGISPDAVKAMETVIGYDAVMEAMRKIGANTREDTFVERGAGGSGTVTTREGAMARKSELMGDAAWTKRYLEGGVAEKNEMTQINTMIDGAA
jgi:hypothetical protein